MSLWLLSLIFTCFASKSADLHVVKQTSQEKGNNVILVVKVIFFLLSLVFPSELRLELSSTKKYITGFFEPCGRDICLDCGAGQEGGKKRMRSGTNRGNFS